MNGGESTYQPCDYPLDGLSAARMGGKRQAAPSRCNAPATAYAPKNGYRTCAVHCSLETIADEAIELLSFIDQPNYSTTLYVIETKGDLA